MDFLNNPTIQNMVLGKLKKHCKEHNLTTVVIHYDKDEDEFKFQLLTGVNHIVPDFEMQELKESYLKSFDK